jgi:hypothetical protein
MSVGRGNFGGCSVTLFSNNSSNNKSSTAAPDQGPPRAALQDQEDAETCTRAMKYLLTDLKHLMATMPWVCGPPRVNLCRDCHGKNGYATVPSFSRISAARDQQGHQRSAGVTDAPCQPAYEATTTKQRPRVNLCKDCHDKDGCTTRSSTKL